VLDEPEDVPDSLLDVELELDDVLVVLDDDSVRSSMQSFAIPPACGPQRLPLGHDPSG
jgi:hypothetical protein